MAGITTASLYSVQSITDLIVTPVFQKSAVLPFLKRIRTEASQLLLPQVGEGSAAWYPELTVINDAGATAKEIVVTPRKVAAYQIVSNESALDANSAEIIGEALVDAVVSAVDDAFVNGAAPDGPAGLPGVVGSSSVDGDPAQLASYIDAIAAIQAVGGVPSVIFISPQDWASISKLPANAGSNIPALAPTTGASAAPTPILYGLPVSVVSALAPGTSWVVDGSRTVVAERIPASVSTNEGPAFNADGLAVRCTMRLEFSSVYPKTVCKIFNTP